jgi:hypothetical protein
MGDGVESDRRVSEGEVKYSEEKKFEVLEN